MSHVFISYHSGDGDFAENVKRRVEDEGLNTWMDTEGLQAGEDWRNNIDKAIKDAFVLIVVMSPEAKASEYVAFEWAFALGAGIKVIPILYKQTGLHPRLEILQYLDFANRVRPWDNLIERLKKVAEDASHLVPIARDAPDFVVEAVNLLSSFSPDERRKAAENLGQIDHPAAREALRGVLRHSFKDVRIYAALALAQTGDESAVPALVEALHREHDKVRWDAMKALERIGKPAIPRLLGVLRDENWELRQAAARVLGQIGDSAAVQGLLEILRDKEKNVRGEAVEALGEIKDAAAVPGLIERLADSETPDVSFSTTGTRIWDLAARALVRIGTPEALSAVEKWRIEHGNAK